MELTQKILIKIKEANQTIPIEKSDLQHNTQWCELSVSGVAQLAKWVPTLVT